MTIAGLMLSAALVAASAPASQTANPASAQAKPSRYLPDRFAGKAAAPAPRARYRPDRFAGKAGRYYRLVWGVDELSVKLVESGELVRFTWRVVDPERAKVLGDKKLAPALVDPQAGVSLVVPTMEKIGALRQGVAPEAGKSYWMTCSNTGLKVTRGARVSVVIGEFRADGLVVD